MFPSFPAGALRLRTYYKVIVANAMIIAAAVFVAVYGAAFLVREVSDRSALELALIVALPAILASALLNGLIVHLALRPVQRLVAVAAKVHGGDLAVRARPSAIDDHDFGRLLLIFNRMLDGLEASREQLRLSSARAVEATEAERARVSRELHDDIGQALAALLLQSRMLLDQDASPGAQALRDGIAEAVERVRRCAQGLRPPALDGLGVPGAVRALARGLSAGNTLCLRVDGDWPSRLAPEAEIAAFRITQEAVANVLRHSSARRLRVRFGNGAGVQWVSVVDDGVGFVVPAPGEGSGRPALGLLGMSERAGYVGGSVRLLSKPGWGSAVRATFPTAVVGA
jgi:two-component system, NarL family, sensor histidine kinase UhpB